MRKRRGTIAAPPLDPQIKAAFERQADDFENRNQQLVNQNSTAQYFTHVLGMVFICLCILCGLVFLALRMSIP